MTDTLATRTTDLSGLESLPNELLIDIFSLACNSQSIYRTLLLVCKCCHRLVKFERLPHIPIRLNTNTAQSFFHFISSEPGLPGRVRYLWLNGFSNLCIAVAQECTNVVCLACSKAILYSLCAGTNRHKSLVELTLFDNHNAWAPLDRLTQQNGFELCHQITHLRLHEQLSPDFNAQQFAQQFPSLTHYSYSGDQITAPALIDHLVAVHGLVNLVHIVVTTFFWADEPVDIRTAVITELDDRLKVVYFGYQEPGEFQLWCGRARKEDCLWTRQTTPKRLL